MDKRSFLKLTLALSTTPSLGLVAGCFLDENVKVRIPTGGKILCAGDSLTAGKGAPKEGTYPALLDRRLGGVISVRNIGVNGLTSSQILQQIEFQWGEGYDAVFVTAGGNDFLRGVPEKETLMNLIAIGDFCRSNNSTPVFFSIPEPSVTGAIGLLSDHPVYGELKKVHRNVIPKTVSKVLSDRDLKSDLIHPNTDGYAVMAESAFNTIKFF